MCSVDPKGSANNYQGIHCWCYMRDTQMKTAQMPKRTIEHLLVLPRNYLQLCLYIYSIARQDEKSHSLPCHTHVSPMQNDAHECLSSTLQKCENRMGRDLKYREDVEHGFAATHVPRVISCAISVHANMECCVHRKQQTCDVEFSALLLLQ